MTRGFRATSDRAGRVIAAALVAGLLVSLVAAYALQRDAAAQPDRPPGVEMPGPFPRVMPAPGGAGLAMVVYKDHIYVAHGSTLYKVKPETMTVVEELQFAKPPPVPMRPANPPPPPGGPE